MGGGTFGRAFPRSRNSRTGQTRCTRDAVLVGVSAQGSGIGSGVGALQEVLQAVGQHLRPRQEGGGQRVLEGGRKIDAGPKHPGWMVSATAASTMKGMPRTSPATFRYHQRLTPYQASSRPGSAFRPPPPGSPPRAPSPLDASLRAGVRRHLRGLQNRSAATYWGSGADRLGLRIGREIAELLDEVPQQEIFAAPSGLGDVGEDQPFQVRRVIPPGGRGVAGQAFAPGAREGDGRLVKISGVIQPWVSMLDSPGEASGFLPMRGG